MQRALLLRGVAHRCSGDIIGTAGADDDGRRCEEKLKSVLIARPHSTDRTTDTTSSRAHYSIRLSASIGTPPNDAPPPPPPAHKQVQRSPTASIARTRGAKLINALARFDYRAGQSHRRQTGMTQGGSAVMRKQSAPRRQQRGRNARAHRLHHNRPWDDVRARKDQGRLRIRPAKNSRRRGRRARPAALRPVEPLKLASERRWLTAGAPLNGRHDGGFVKNPVKTTRNAAAAVVVQRAIGRRRNRRRGFN
uniref:Uncharacterized protein n=1 Tax=Plectus sambesii TaxID=2011161 RepID=A0A914VMQ4_9BILA